MKTFLLVDGDTIPAERTPADRPNTFTPGTCKWAAWEALNRLDGVFTEADIIIPYYRICRECKIRPRRAERTIRDVVTELVKARILTRVGSKKIQHATK